MDRVVRAVTNASNAVGVSLLLAMMFLLTADVTLRYALNRPITGSLELTEFMMVAVVFLGLAYAQQQRAHVRVDLIVTRLPRRPQAALDSITLILSILLYAFIAWKGYERAVELLHKGLVSDLLRIPHFPFRILVAISAVLLCLELVLTLRGRLRVLFSMGGG